MQNPSDFSSPAGFFASMPFPERGSRVMLTAG
jgi:hypothetical protein